MPVSLSALYLLVGCSGRDGSKELNPASTTGWWVDVSTDGERYYGLAIEEEFYRDGASYSTYSSVVLSPWDARSGTTVSLSGNTTIFRLKHGAVRIVGRHVCLVNTQGTELKVIPQEIPEDAFESREKLQGEIAIILEEAQQVGTGQPATRPMVEPEGNDKPQPDAEGRSR